MKSINFVLYRIWVLFAILFVPRASAQTVNYTHEGTTIRLRTIEINAGADRPFSVLHISDSHLAYADARDGARKVKLAATRRKTATSRYAALMAHREYARKNNMIIVHSGDFIDFVSQANLEYAEAFFSEGDWIVCAGNHEYSQYVGEAKEDDAYRAQSYDKVQAAFPNDLTFYSRVVNGINFVTLDNGYYKFSKEQFAKMKAEVKKGLPIIMVCHVPLYTPEMCNRIQKGNKAKATLLAGAPRKVTDAYAHKERPAGEEWRNPNILLRADKTTLKFCKWLKRQEELKAILTGHCHFHHKTQFSKSATQYTVGRGNGGNGYIVNIK